MVRQWCIAVSVTQLKHHADHQRHLVIPARYPVAAYFTDGGFITGKVNAQLRAIVKPLFGDRAEQAARVRDLDSVGEHVSYSCGGS